MARPSEGVSKKPIAFKPTLENEPLLLTAKHQFNIDYAELINRALARHLPEIIREILAERKKGEAELLKLVDELEKNQKRKR